MINRSYILLLLLLLLFSLKACIYPYDAEIEEEKRIISVEGSLIKGEEIQTIVISETTSMLDPRFNPVTGCEVKILDDLFKEFLFIEDDPGIYTQIISDDELVYNRQYMLRITTPGGDIYESEYELLNAAAEVDSVYYGIEEIFDASTGAELNGVQYYIDIKAPDDVPRFFRWKMEETYEYTTSGPISYIYHHPDLDPFTPDNQWEFYRCWVTEKIPGLFLSNTINLTTNEKKKIPLHYISTESDRMKIRYNLLVKQYTMNEGAYNYWQQNKTATQESGGLYTGQPDQPITNIYNVNGNKKRALGFFWVSSKTEKRIVVPRPNELFVMDYKCYLFEFDPEEYKAPWPVYIRFDEENKIEYTGPLECFDCRARGGSLTPPNFWE